MVSLRQHLRPNGTYLGTIGADSLSSPRDVTITSNGQLFVSNQVGNGGRVAFIIGGTCCSVDLVVCCRYLVIV